MTQKISIDDVLCDYLKNEKEYEEMMMRKIGDNDDISISNVIRKRLFLPKITRGARTDLKKKVKYEEIFVHIITIFQRYGGQRKPIPKFRLFDNRYPNNKLNEALKILKKDYYFIYINKLKTFEVWKTEIFDNKEEEVINEILERYKDGNGNRFLKRKNLKVRKHGFIGELPKGYTIKRKRDETVEIIPIEFIYKINTKYGDSYQFYDDYESTENTNVINNNSKENNKTIPNTSKYENSPGDLVLSEKKLDKLNEYFWYDDPMECYQKIINLSNQNI
jgi:hypothetical protein